MLVFGATSNVSILGTTPTAAVVGGGVAVLAGLVGFARLLTAARPQATGRQGAGYGLLTLASTVLVVAGGAVLLGAGILQPLGNLKARMTYAIQSQGQHAAALQKSHEELLHANRELLSRIAQMQADQLQHLKESAQLEQLWLKSISQVEIARFLRETLNDPKRQDPKRLHRHEFRVSSQNGEDGIIAEIFRRIGTTNRYFVEFGASDGLQNNTAYLVRQGWGGLWMDADTPAIERARTTFAPELADGRLTILETFITAENIEDLFRQGKVPEEFDLLSVDIDRNDYHVWEKIEKYNPRVVVVEYNAGLPPELSWVIPYDPKAYGFNSFGNGNGASLKALEELGARKGYSLVGCNLAGVNAFFVRNDLLGDHFAAPYTAENHFEAFRHGYITW